MGSSRPSSTCRIEWRPSRLLAGALAALGALAVWAVGLSALPVPWSILLGGAAVVTAMLLAKRHLQQPVRSLVWAGPGEPALIGMGLDAVRLDAVCLHLRGPLAVLGGIHGNGRRQHWVWYPDTLSVADRRALRMAAMNTPVTVHPLPILLS